VTFKRCLRNADFKSIELFTAIVAKRIKSSSRSRMAAAHLKFMADGWLAGCWSNRKRHIEAKTYFKIVRIAARLRPFFFPTGNSETVLLARVARWYIFIPIILNWEYLGRPWNVKCWYILWPFGIFYGRLEYFPDFWYILSRFNTYYPVLVCFTKKNLTTLLLGYSVAWRVLGILSIMSPAYR
jgi:hypothetical protein